VSAWSNDEGSSKEIMAVRHRELFVEGVQFHPESILSEHGYQILKNFLDLSQSERRDEK
jgi:anthranilate/para-aminobenzoate synthase component II